VEKCEKELSPYYKLAEGPGVARGNKNK